jgi:hypothetical protein
MGFHGCLCMVNRCGLWRFHKDRGTPTSKSWITLLKPMVTWGSSILGTYRTYIIWEKPWENNQLLRYDEIAMIQPKCCGQTFRSCHVENASWLSSSSVLFLGVSFRNGSAIPQRLVWDVWYICPVSRVSQWGLFFVVFTVPHDEQPLWLKYDTCLGGWRMVSCL